MGTWQAYCCLNEIIELCRAGNNTGSTLLWNARTVYSWIWSRRIHYTRTCACTRNENFVSEARGHCSVRKAYSRRYLCVVALLSQERGAFPPGKGQLPLSETVQRPKPSVRRDVLVLNVLLGVFGTAEDREPRQSDAALQVTRGLGVTVASLRMASNTSNTAVPQFQSGSAPRYCLRQRRSPNR